MYAKCRRPPIIPICSEGLCESLSEMIYISLPVSPRCFLVFRAQYLRYLWKEIWYTDIFCSKVERYWKWKGADHFFGPTSRVRHILKSGYIQGRCFRRLLFWSKIYLSNFKIYQWLFSAKISELTYFNSLKSSLICWNCILLQLLSNCARFIFTYLDRKTKKKEKCIYKTDISCVGPSLLYYCMLRRICHVHHLT